MSTSAALGPESVVALAATHGLTIDPGSVRLNHAGVGRRSGGCYAFRRIFSMALPWATSSTSLSM